MILFCYVLNVATLAEELDEYMTDRMKIDYGADQSDVITLVFIGALALTICVSLVYTVRQLMAAASVPVLKLKATDKAPELQLSGNHLWHLFLCAPRCTRPV